ncbi:C2H2 type zinc finger domain-containing protein [Cordyceps militaris CM01]|uniref:C2H2 type zinc finger domain-containing protein n=2 Tax=Cordyceps militaris TaxID=73501 RepID=G3JBD6_CORMM|nr:C2H2 type zinc finger domain-containing protein [Cordyceps militaris CM01]ATY61159.1 C2H2 type zinc finger domain-containing [Cordyceps militaris]EGX94443.1 C2H2 type zinc finger domain-containing protein [Cordyceps militaris CM01]
MKRSREPQEDINLAYPGSPDGDMLPSGLQHAAKYTELDPAVGQVDTESSSLVRILCSLPPHSEMAFDSYTAYEVHYSSHHTNRCLQCRKNFPSEHLLGVHIEELHDPIVRVRRDQGAHTYSCFVEGCDRKCMTPQKRRMHMIDKHSYPKNFFFAVTRDGIDGRRSLLVEGGGGGRSRRRSSSAASQTKEARRRAATLEGKTPGAGEQPSESQAADQQQATSSAKVDDDIDAITGSMASLRFVPAVIKFGTRNRRGFAKQ